MPIAAAGTYADRVVAVASFHSGGLVTDATDSLHLYGSNLRSELTLRQPRPTHITRPQCGQLSCRLGCAGRNFHVRDLLCRPRMDKAGLSNSDEAVAEQGWKEMISFFDRL